MKKIVVIPTYNESENIVNLINQINKLEINDMHILIVDDNSPDGTADLVRKISKKNNNVHLLSRTADRGRGSAGIAGFKKALEIGGDIICEMDADFSHNPKYLPDLINKLRDCDVTIGSRFVSGGSDEDRPFLRRLLTILANFYIRVLLGLKVGDCNSGYRCFRRDVLQKINLDKITSRGPSIVQEILYKAHLAGFSIKEIPIEFVERKEGKSKLGLRHLYKGYTMVLKLKFLRLIGRI